MTSCRKVEQALQWPRSKNPGLGPLCLGITSTRAVPLRKGCKKEEENLKITEQMLHTHSFSFLTEIVCVCVLGMLIMMCILFLTLSLLPPFRHVQPLLCWSSSCQSQEAAHSEDHQWAAAAQASRLNAGGQRRGKMLPQCETQTFSLLRYTSAFQILPNFWSLKSTLPPACVLLVLCKNWFVLYFKEWLLCTLVTAVHSFDANPTSTWISWNQFPW